MYGLCMVEYASPVWAAIPKYLQDLLETIQKKSLYIIFGCGTEYTDAMITAGLQTLSARRELACKQFITKARQCPPLKNTIPIPSAARHAYNLRACLPRPQLGHTNRLNNFVTIKYQHII